MRGGSLCLRRRKIESVPTFSFLALSFFCLRGSTQETNNLSAEATRKCRRSRTPRACEEKRAVEHRLTPTNVETLMHSTLLSFFALPYLADLGVLLIGRLDLDVVRKHVSKRTLEEKDSVCRIGDSLNRWPLEL